MGITAIELAKGEPPYSDLHPMRVLLQIPKNPPPQLTENYSRPFREFVEACLQKNPEHVCTTMKIAVESNMCLRFFSRLIRDQQSNNYENFDLYQQTNQRNISSNRSFVIKIGRKLIRMEPNLIVIPIPMMMSTKREAIRRYSFNFLLFSQTKECRR